MQLSLARHGNRRVGMSGCLIIEFGSVEYYNYLGKGERHGKTI